MTITASTPPGLSSTNPSSPTRPLHTGTRLLNIPRNSFSLLNVYEFQDGVLKGLGLGAGGKYVDERAGQTANTAFSMDAYTVVDLLSY